MSLGTSLNDLPPPLTALFPTMDAVVTKLQQIFTNYDLLHAKATQLEKENSELKNKYIRALEEKQMTELKKENERVTEELSKVTTKLDQLMKEANTTNERVILGELGKQVEKANCRKVLGTKSRIHSLILLQDRINSQPERELSWEDFVKQVRWTDRLEQMVVTLKESFAGHPTLDTKNKPITKDYASTAQAFCFKTRIFGGCTPFGRDSG